METQTPPHSKDCQEPASPHRDRPQTVICSRCTPTARARPPLLHVSSCARGRLLGRGSFWFHHLCRLPSDFVGRERPILGSLETGTRPPRPGDSIREVFFIERVDGSARSPCRNRPPEPKGTWLAWGVTDAAERHQPKKPKEKGLQFSRLPTPPVVLKALGSLFTGVLLQRSALRR